MANQDPPSLCCTLPSAEIRKAEVVRRTAGFHPTVWGDHFLNYPEEQKKVDEWTGKVELLKEEVRRMLINCKGSVQELNLIDHIQRLGVAYHFEKEIDEALHRIYNAYTNVHYDDLYATALRFRLLRQSGYNVSSDVFRNFKDEDENFKETLRSDVRGMLSLYEAAYLGIQGEDILDEAIVFTSGHLKTIVDHLHPPLVAKVRRALELPLHKRIPRLESRYYISLYQEDESHNDVLLELARLDFNCLQSLHQRELRDLSRWELEASEGLPDYMKACYLALLNTVDEIESQMMPNEKFYRTNYIKREMKVLVQSYLDEAKWVNRRHVPKLEEHLHVSLLSCGFSLLTGVGYVGMGDVASKEVFDWLDTHPKFVMDLSIVCRLVDDIVGHHFEQEREHVASTVECYMKEHGVSEEEACTKLREMIATGWKDINKACLRPSVSPLPLLLRGTNFPRVIEDLYIHGDGYTHSKHETKVKVVALLVDPVPIPM